MSKNSIDIYKFSDFEENNNSPKFKNEEFTEAEIIEVPKDKFNKLNEAFVELIKDISDDELSQKLVNFIRAGRDLGMVISERSQLAKDFSVKESIEFASETTGLIKDLTKLLIKDGNSTELKQENRQTAYATIIDEKNSNLAIENAKDNTKQLPFNGLGENGLALENKSPNKPLNPNGEVKSLEAPKKPFKLTGKYCIKEKSTQDRTR